MCKACILFDYLLPIASASASAGDMWHYAKVFKSMQSVTIYAYKFQRMEKYTNSCEKKKHIKLCKSN